MTSIMTTDNMKKIVFKHGFWAVLIAVLMASTLYSCDNASKKRACRHWSKEVSHPFPNTNWSFEEAVQNFDFDIEDTTRFYEVSVALLYDTAVATLLDIPLSLTLSTPDGMKSFSTSHFLLKKQENPDIKMVEGNKAEASVIVYPSRKFKVPGTYTLTVYRRAEKADNYGFHSLSAKVKVAK